ncbi:WD repeat-containing protein 76-like isoform X3 [Symsagittifera roscoffensis]|uniref:WD repeat-containing protein 76-like isoform X3 n=1 Tax=Symsagittifera roscoffensis TaxID=84072 RepID=UPI00307B2772
MEHFSVRRSKRGPQPRKVIYNWTKYKGIANLERERAEMKLKNEKLSENKENDSSEEMQSGPVSSSGNGGATSEAGASCSLTHRVRQKKKVEKDKFMRHIDQNYSSSSHTASQSNQKVKQKTGPKSKKEESKESVLKAATDQFSDAVFDADQMESHKCLNAETSDELDSGSICSANRNDESSEEEETKQVNSESEEAVNDSCSELPMLERIRRKNVARNEKFLLEFELQAGCSVLPPKKTKKYYPRKETEVNLEPSRKSARCLGIGLDNENVNPLSGVKRHHIGLNSRLETFAHLHKGEFIILSDPINYGKLRSSLKEAANSEIKAVGESGKSVLNTDETLEKLAKLELKHVGKCCDARSYALQFHPGNKLIVTTGDKYGNLCFWDIDEDAKHCDSGKVVPIFLRDPFLEPIRCMKYSRFDWSKLYTCSYCGFLNSFDLNTGQFTRLCQEESVKYPFDSMRSYYDKLNGFYWFDLLHDEKTICVSDLIGHIILVDPRKRGVFPPAFSNRGIVNNDYKVKCVSAHPSKPYIISSDQDSLRIWDLRNTNERCIDVLCQADTVNGAFFSPVTGDKILTTCYDSYLRVFDSKNLTKNSVKATVNISHPILKEM